MALSEDDDLVQRGRAIFDRLRETQPEDSAPANEPGEHPLPEETAPAEPAAEDADELSAAGGAPERTDSADSSAVDEAERADAAEDADEAEAADGGAPANGGEDVEPVPTVAEVVASAAAVLDQGSTPPADAPEPGVGPGAGGGRAPGSAAEVGPAGSVSDAPPAPPGPAAAVTPATGPSTAEAPVARADADADADAEGAGPLEPPSAPEAGADAASIVEPAPPAAAAAEPPPAEPQSAAPPAPAARANPLVRPLPRIMAIANQKGGVGKTTTAVNLGASLADLGYRVLVIDLDPQGNATTGLGINPRTLETSVYDVIMHDTAIEDCIEPTSLRNLFVVPATIDLAGAEIELVPAFSRELKLRRALEQVADEFDYTLIDCPPSLGLITINGLAAATEVVVPIQCEYYALEGLGQLLRNVNLVQGNLNPKLEVSAIILTMFDARTKLADQVAQEVRAHFGDKVCRNIVPRTVRLSEAPSFGQPIIVFDPSSRGAIAYRELAKEVSGGSPQRPG